MKSNHSTNKAQGKWAALHLLVSDRPFYSACMTAAHAPQLEADATKAAAHEELLVFPHFDEATAWELGTALRAAAEREGVSVLIDIRRGDDCLFLTAMPGTAPANADWARRKRNLVNLLHKSSFAIGLALAQGLDILELMGLDPRDHAPHGGCFPIRIAGTGVVGTATVSGLPQRDDHRLVVETIAAYLGLDLGDNAL